MKTNLRALAILGTLILTQLSTAEARTVRATELNPQIWSQYNKGEFNELTVEFRQGDEVPLNFQAEGDLLETKVSNPSYLGVKRTFWVRMEQKQILMSLDGVNFKPFNQIIGGSFTVGASSEPNGGPANALNVLLKAFLK